MTIGSISFDHPDPSIFTVLTSPSRHARHRQLRLRDLPAALAGDGRHLPSALVPPQPDERVHGPGLRRVRRQARAASSPAAPACTTAWCRTAPTRKPSTRPAAPTSKPHKLDNTLAFMFESRYRFIPTEFALQSPRARRRLRRLLGRPQGPIQAMNNALNATHDPALRSWVASANSAGCDFPIQNLPFGRFRPRRQRRGLAHRRRDRRPGARPAGRPAWSTPTT